LITDAGHDLRRRSTKQDWKQLLDEPADLVVAAGGDGTVRRVALEAASRCLPFSAIPIGTANNIAKSLGLLGEAADLIETWSPSPRAEHPFDLGEVVAPWGTKRFVEGVGAGLVADLISREDEVAADAKLLGRATDRALHLLSVLVREEPMHRWKIRADGRDLSGEYFSVEVLNTRFVGPNLPLAARAYPGDGLLDVVLLRKADREPLHGYLMLAERLYTDGHEYASAWNFGPPESSEKTVGWVIEKLYELWGVTFPWTRDKNPAGGGPLAPGRSQLAVSGADCREIDAFRALPCRGPEVHRGARLVQRRAAGEEPAGFVTAKPPRQAARRRTAAAMQATRSGAWAWPGSRAGS
jgi:diacylglycerol kinase family enzyme